MYIAKNSSIGAGNIEPLSAAYVETGKRNNNKRSFNHFIRKAIQE